MAKDLEKREQWWKPRVPINFAAAISKTCIYHFL